MAFDALENAWTLPASAPPVRRAIFVGCDYTNNSGRTFEGDMDAKGGIGWDVLKLYALMVLGPNLASPDESTGATAGRIQYTRYASLLVEDIRRPELEELDQVSRKLVTTRPDHLSGIPTKTDILGPLAMLARVSRMGDAAWFHFHGHGSSDWADWGIIRRTMAYCGLKTADKYLCYTSPDPNDPSATEKISKTELTTILNTFHPGVNPVINLDACHTADWISPVSPARGLLITATDSQGLSVGNAALDKTQASQLTLRENLCNIDQTAAAMASVTPIIPIRLPPPLDTKPVADRRYEDVLTIIQVWSTYAGKRLKCQVTANMVDPEGRKGKKFLETLM